MKNFWPFGAAVRFIKREPVLFAALLLAICASAITRPQPSLYIQAIDFRTLAILFCLMITIKAFQSQNFLDYAAACLLRLCKDRRSLYLLLAALVFFSSMLVTNDVALLTFVPITLLIFRRLGLSPLKIVVLETLAANLGSCATPMGNPQNLYLFSRYNFSAADFFMQTAKIALPSIFILAAIIFFITKKTHDEPHEFSDATLQQQRVIVKTGARTFFYAAEFAVCLLTVFRALPWPAMLAFVAAISILCDASLFKKVDYSLLFTFAGFFIFTKTISTVPAFSDFMQSALSSRLSTYIAGIAASQVISNVPAALLLSGFTQDGAALLLAVNAGGLGTLIASMASVISFKLYAASDEAKKPGSPSYMATFTLWNVVLLLIIGTVAFLL
ncbi:MAG: citrate transporter [Treponema sp.]|nr:citrate transporter [Treponema sp.]